MLAMVLSHSLASGEEAPKTEFPGDAERKAKMTAEELAWETLLEQNLGKFYLPRYKEAKAKGHETAWDYVKDEPKLPRVLLIGDSISRGYTMPTRRALAGKVNVHRAPENCGNSLNGLRKLEIYLGDGKWDLIHVNFGIHDRKFSGEDHADRVGMIIGRLAETGAKLVWASSTPIPANAEFYEHGSSARMNKVASEIMERRGIPINDLYSLMLPDLKKYQNFRDCHFNQEGYELLGGKVAEAILAALNDGGKATVGGPAEAAVERETLIFSDDFDRQELGEGWHVARGEASIKDGRVHLKGPATITTRMGLGERSLGRDLRVEYDGVSEDPCDLSLLANVVRTGEFESGYFFGFGCQFNKVNKLIAFDTEICRSTEHLIVTGKKHHVCAEKRGSTLRMLVDGKEILRADGQRLHGSGSIGFYVWNSASFDNLKVYALPPETSKDKQ